MASLPNPVELLSEPGDKVQHMIAFAVLALLGAQAYHLAFDVQAGEHENNSGYAFAESFNGRMRGE